jgi:chromosome segregation ATPase
VQKQQENRHMTLKSAEPRALSTCTGKHKTMRSKSTPRTTKYDGSKTTKRDNSRSTALTSSISQESKNFAMVNEALAAENKRLKQRLVAKGKDEKEFAEVETDVVKLNRKIKMLEMKRKEEKGQTMKMSKHVEAHLAGLRRELAKALDHVDTLERDQESDTDQILKLTEELERWRQSDGSPRAKELESELRRRNNELEMVLEFLEAKVQKIIELEIQLHNTKEKLRMAQYTSAKCSGYDEPQSTRTPRVKSGMQKA